MAESKKILIATENPGKFREIIEILKNLPFEFVFLGSLDIPKNLEETGSTHEENAMLKAKHFHDLTGLPTIGEDSGIYVDALKNELGISTRRWGKGAKASDKEWLIHFMEIMKDKDNRKASFVSVAAFTDGKEIKTFTGETKGEVSYEIEAPIKTGVPLSSVFRPTGETRVYNALSESEKAKTSHRGKAFTELKTWLKKHVINA